MKTSAKPKKDSSNQDQSDVIDVSDTKPKLTQEQINERNKLVEENMGLVYSIVLNKFHFAEYIQDDLIQEGMLGLMAAAERFDRNRGYKFSTYAMRYILGYILEALKNRYYSSPARIPMSQFEKIQKFKKAREKLALKLNREPSLEELSKSMGIPLNKIKELLEDEKMLYTSSLDEPINEEGGSIYDLVPSQSPNPENLVSESEYEFKSDAILDTVLRKKLTQRELLALAMQFNIDFLIPKDISEKNKKASEEEGYTLKEIGGVIGISRERVRQITEVAKDKVRSDERIKRLAA